MGQAMERAAEAILKKAGIRGERGVATHETSAGMGISEALSDVVPGVDLLRGKSRLIVVVTDRNVYLLEGRSFGRVGAQIAAFPTASDAFAFDDRHLIFPDGTRVQMNSHQAGELIAATGGELNYVRANYALRRLGVEGEAGLGTATGIEPSTERRTIAGRVSPVIDVTDLFDPSKAEGRIVLFSDRNVRLFEGRTIASMGRELGCFPIGSGVDVRDDVAAFPNGQVVKFPSPRTAQRVAEVTRTGEA